MSKHKHSAADLQAAANRGPRAVAALLVGTKDSYSLRMEDQGNDDQGRMVFRVTDRQGRSYTLRGVGADWTLER